MKFPTAKVLLFLAIVVIVTVIVGSIQPLIVTDISIKAQLADSDSSYVLYKLYKSVTSYGWLVYVLVAFLMFRKELKYLTKRGNNNEAE